MQAHRIWTSLLVAAAFCASSATHASIVHRCRQLDGIIAYRETGCLPEESLVSRLEFAEPIAAAPPEPPARLAGKQAREDTQAARAQPPSRTASTADRIVAHECRFGEQRWVQAEACPASLATAATRGAKPAKQRVDETRLTESQVCEVLRTTSSAHSSGEGSARRAYAMNRLRQRHGC